MKKIIFLNGERIEYEKTSDLKNKLPASDVEIASDAEIGSNVKIAGYVEIGSNVKIGSDVEIGRGVKIAGYVKIASYAEIGSNVKIRSYVDIGSGVKIASGARITRFNFFSAQNLYRHVVSGHVDDDGKETVQMGCFKRTRQEWEADFWNNPKEFSDDGSDESEARFRAFKVVCFFFDQLKNKNGSKGLPLIPKGI